MPKARRIDVSSIGGIEDQLREAIEADGRSCRQLGADAGVEPKMIGLFCRRLVSMSLESAARLARALDLRLVAVGRGRGRPTAKGKQS